MQRFDTVPKGYRPNVGVVLINRAGLVFGGQRADTKTPAWQMPQGGMDQGETVQAAALRELAEETGVGAALVEPLAETEAWLAYDLPPDLAARMWGGRFKGQAQKWVALRFLGTDADIDLECHHPEFSTWRWLRAAELEAGIVAFKRPIYRAVLAEFAAFLSP
ncbi:MAG: RNA pyrophosphohydrolase [Geminicoccaceae bacterium]|nr:MAG: RNA pyrophosphohydrolase [Geminicoccaceae bacterium]